jgi:hypothetical protein
MENTVHFCNLIEKLLILILPKPQFEKETGLHKGQWCAFIAEQVLFCFKGPFCLKKKIHPSPLFFFFASPLPHWKLEVWIILLRTFCHTWMPNHYVLLNLYAKNGTEWHQMACYGRSLSREWSGQILCGEVWQNEEGGEPFNFFLLQSFLRTWPFRITGRLLGTSETTYHLIRLFCWLIFKNVKENSSCTHRFSSEQSFIKMT